VSRLIVISAASKSLFELFKDDPFDEDGDELDGLATIGFPDLDLPLSFKFDTEVDLLFLVLLWLVALDT
jgi:hypothetical protein